MGGAKRKGAAIRFQKLIWPMAAVRKTSSLFEKRGKTAAKAACRWGSVGLEGEGFGPREGCGFAGGVEAGVAPGGEEVEFGTAMFMLAGGC